MRASTTTRALSAFLSRPAFRVMDQVARQLGVRLPAASSSVEEATTPSPSSEAVPPAPGARSPASPASTGASLSSRPAPADTGVGSASAPPPPREAVRSSSPVAPATSGRREAGKHIVRLLPRSSLPPGAPGPVMSGEAASVSSSTPGAEVPGPVTFNTAASLSPPVVGPTPVTSGAAVSFPPSVSRVETAGPTPSFSPVETPGGTPFDPASRVGLQGPPLAEAAQVDVGALPSTASSPPSASRPRVRSEPGPRVVRLLSRTEPEATSTSVLRTSHEEVPSAEGPSHLPSDPVRAGRPSEPEGKGPSRARLTFLPGPEPLLPSANGERAALPPPEAASNARPAADTALLAARVTSGMAPVWEQAQQLTQPSLPVGRASPGASGMPPPAGGAVRNTFNVNVHLDPSAPPGGMSRRELEDALVDILREAARRHGLEI